MLKIRSEQVQLLAESSQRVFERRMLAHIEKHFPEHYLKLGQHDCLQLICFGVERGKLYDFVSERNVCKYIDLMLCFGVEFDTDSKQPWAAKILNDESWVSVDMKMSALFEQGILQLEA